MNENNIFNKESVHNKLLEKRGLLEQLQVPPPVIAFLRNNATALQIGAVSLVFFIIAWNGYQYYVARQLEKSTALLAVALKETTDEGKGRALEQVLREYPRTAAGAWSRLELAHMDYKAGRYQKAIEQYKQAQDFLGSANSLNPLLLYSLALTYEADAKSGEAINTLEQLATITGFADPAYMALARIYEARGDLTKAKENYGKVTSKGYQDSIKERLAKLEASSGKPSH